MSARVSQATPWPGLEAYEEADAKLFFGRNREKHELRRLVGNHPLVIVYGISGLGKTSLLQAGLFPELREDDFLPILLRLGKRTPADRTEAGVPAGSYADRLVREVRRQAHEAKGRAPEPDPHGASLWEYFHRTHSQFWSEGSRLLTPVLVLDQFEEFFIAEGRSDAEHEAADQFFGELAELVYNRRPESLSRRLESREVQPAAYVFGPVPLRVVISLREDFLPQLSQMGRRRFPTLLDAMFRLRPLGVEAAKACIEGPAPDLFEPDAVEPLVKFLANAEKTAEDSPAAAEASSAKWVEPALLSIVCRELSERRIPGKQISRDLLDVSRNQILADFYERSWKGVAPELRKYVECNLVTKGGFRQALALEGAVEQRGVTVDDIETMVERRILHYLDRQEGPRCIEFTHDILCKVALASREKTELAEREAKAESRRVRTLWVAGLSLTVAGFAVALAVYALQKRHAAEAATVTAQRATAGATEIIRTIQEQLRDAYAKKHDLQLVADVDQHVADTLQKMYGDRPQDANGQGEIADYLDQVGDAQFAMGHLGEARKNYQAAFDIRTRIAKQPGSGPAILASLADSYDNLGQMDVADAETLDPDADAAKIGDDLAKARANFTTALSMFEKIPGQAGSGQALAESGIARSQELIGDAYEAGGEADADALEDRESAGYAPSDAEKAAIVKEFEAALDAHRKALTAARTNGTAVQGGAAYDDQLSAQGKIEDFMGNDQEEEGEFNHDNNKLMDALRSYGDAYKIRDYLCRRDAQNSGHFTGEGLYVLGNNFEWADDLSESADHIGDVYRSLGDLDMALAWHVMCIEIKRDLAKKDPNNAEWKGELSSSYDHAGEIAQQQGDAAKKDRRMEQARNSLAASLGYYQASLDIDENLAALFPNDTHRLRELAESHRQVSEVLEDEADTLPAAEGKAARDRAAQEQKKGQDILAKLKENAVDKEQAIHDAVRELQH